MSRLHKRPHLIAQHVRSNPDGTGWGGDLTETVDVTTQDISVWLEWREGTDDNYDLWTFTDVDIQEEDIFLIDDVAYVVQKLNRYTKLNGTFHNIQMLVTISDAKHADIDAEVNP